MKVTVDSRAPVDVSADLLALPMSATSAKRLRLEPRLAAVDRASGGQIRAAFAKSEELIDGRVRLELYKGGIAIQGRESHSSLYDRELSSMDVEGGYDQADARGFIRINALRLRAHQLIVERTAEDKDGDGG